MEATHIIIPIKDFEDILKTKHPYKSVDEIIRLFKSSKQISLDEKDIEEKAINYLMSLEGEQLERDCDTQTQIAYQQALKDLIK